MQQDIYFWTLEHPSDHYSSVCVFTAHLNLDLKSTFQQQAEDSEDTDFNRTDIY